MGNSWESRADSDIVVEHLIQPWDVFRFSNSTSFGVEHSKAGATVVVRVIHKDAGGSAVSNFAIFINFDHSGFTKCFENFDPVL